MSGYVASLLCEFWFHMDGCTNDFTMTVRQPEPEDLSDYQSKTLFDMMSELVPNLSSVIPLFSSTTQQQQQEPSTFDDVINYTVLLRLPDRMKLIRPEQTHFFGLCFLEAATVGLDSMLFLQNKYHFQEVLLKMQRNSYSEEHGFFIIDQNSIMRNKLLVMTSLLGGPNERKIPPQTLSEVNVLFLLLTKILFWFI